MSAPPEHHAALQEVGALIEQWRPRLLREARRANERASADHIEEMLSEAILKFFEHFQEKELPEHPIAYLCAIIKTHSAARRKRAQRESQALKDHAHDSGHPEYGELAKNLSPAAEQFLHAEADDLAFHARLEGLRASLDRVRWQPASARAKVDLWAVFLLNLRLTPTIRIIERGEALLDAIVEALEAHMPWSQEERELQIRETLDLLWVLWEVCKGWAHEHQSLSFEEVVEAINAHHRAPVLTLDQWNQWRTRAKRAMEHSCDEQEMSFERLFGDLFELR